MKKRYIFSIILLILAFIFYLFYREGSLAFNKTDKSNKIFVVNRGESLDTIVNNLAKDDLIRSKVVFFLIVKQL